MSVLCQFFIKILKNRLEDSMNNDFELAFKLEAINNYIAFLEVKTRG